MQTNWEFIVDDLGFFGIPFQNLHTNFAEIVYPNLQDFNSFQINTKVKDLVGTPAVNGYSNLSLKHKFISPSGTSIKISGYTSETIPYDSTNNADYSVPYTNGMIPVFIVRRLATTVTPGNYNANFNLEIWGFNSLNVDTLIDSFTFEIRTIERLNADDPFLLHHTTEFKHIQGATTLPTKKVYLSYNIQKLVVPTEFVLSSNDPNIIITQQSGQYVATLSNNTIIAEVDITLNNSFLTASPQPPTTYILDNIYDDIVNQVSILSESFATIEVIDNNSTNLTFYSTIDLSTAVSQIILLSNPLLNDTNPDFSISYSQNWLLAQSRSMPNEIEVFANKVPFTTAGTYTGVIELKLLGVVKHTINITHIVNSFGLTNPYPASKKAFTLDAIYFTLSSVNTNTYFQFNFGVTANKFHNLGEFPQKIIKQKIIPFQGKAKINIGQTIHRLMDRFLEVNNDVEQYETAKITFSCFEKLISNNNIVNQIFGNIPTIEFVAGLSKNFNDYGFLNINQKPSRVTTNSFALLNYIEKPFETDIKIFVNNIFNSTIFNSTNQNKIRLEKVFFNNFHQGDVVRFELKNSYPPITLYATKTFVVFPKGLYSNMIVWEDEFLLQSAMEFTGKHNIKTDFEFQTFKNYENLVEHLQILDTKKEVKLTINTGWLLKTDVDSIESLMRSKRAWVVRVNDTVELRPISKSIINEDADTELIEFAVEFLIQRKYNEETYTF